jgi:hypothetical protein
MNANLEDFTENDMDLHRLCRLLASTSMLLRVVRFLFSIYVHLFTIGKTQNWRIQSYHTTTI